MNKFLVLAFLFFVGSVSGWVLELFYRKFFSSSNPERKWVNPGFCTGPYVPLYGFGLCILYVIASLESVGWINELKHKKIFLFIIMAILMTLIEYIAGVFLLKVYNLRLWDYREEKWNVQGIICPKFSIAWALLGAVYYFFIHPFILNALDWLSRNLAFSFVIGLFYGVFIIDVANSLQIVNKVKAYAKENNFVASYESLKLRIREGYEKKKATYYFFSPFRSERSFTDYLKDLRDHSDEPRQPRLKKGAGK